MRLIRPLLTLLGVVNLATPVLAASFCGNMQMPAADLKYLSRGFAGGHSGVDLMAAHGSPIRSAAGGTVIFTGWYFAYGKIVDIQHSDNVITRYGHMSAFAPGIAPGSPVAEGQLIGRVGATGRANGPHVHFEVRVNGRAVDPKPYLALARCPTDQGTEPVLEALAREAPRQRR